MARKRTKRRISAKRRRPLRNRYGRMHRSAFQLGITAAKEMLLQHEIIPFQLMDMNRRWNHWLKLMKYSVHPWSRYLQLNRSFFQGITHQSRIPAPHWLLLPTDQTVAAIVTAMNEETTIDQVLNQLKRMPLTEIIVVVNGSKDQTFHMVRKHADVVAVHFNEPLGHDVGRALGAKISRSDIMLFLDGDIPVKAEQLIPFIGALNGELDAALNEMTPYLNDFSQRDGVTIVKEMLNRVLGRPDLGANSLTAVPHALTRRAVETIGFENLAVPPKAQAIAIKKGLRIGPAAGVDVVASNRIRKTNVGIQNPVSELIIGDHVEALHYVFKEDGARMSYADEIRKRNAVFEVNV